VSEATQSATHKALKEAFLLLLKSGVIEVARNPNVYRQLLQNRAQVESMLEPLDLIVRLDEVRGLIFLAVAQRQVEESADDTEEWLHPLVRRIRLTLDQSLLVAILRRLFIGHEQEAGTGSEVTASVDDVLPDLRSFLGDPGSDLQEEKRVRALLEQLRTHGIVSEVDENDKFVIRPLIVHLANPENLKVLIDALKHAHQQAQATAEGASE
jgi:hypothetical protein